MPDNMKIVDFHMHPGPRWCPTERRLHELPVKENFQLLIKAMDRAGIDQAVTFLLDEDWFRTDACEELFQVLQAEGWNKRLHLCAMFDIFRIFETDDVLGYIDRAAQLGIAGIKAHPTLQRITQRDLPLLKPLGKKANEHGLFVVVHVYGYHPNMSENMGLEAVATLAPIVKTPLVIAHGGGLDLPKAVGLAKQYPHIMLDLSYLLELEEEPGVDVKQLLAFALENLGPERILFGSDHPSCDARQYKERYLSLFKALELSEAQIRGVMGENALKLFQRAKQHQPVSS